jgi:hypothetical protein
MKEKESERKQTLKKILRTGEKERGRNEEGRGGGKCGEGK